MPHADYNRHEAFIVFYFYVFFLQVKIKNFEQASSLFFL
jgi:hypothetical protein